MKSIDIAEYLNSKTIGYGKCERKGNVPKIEDTRGVWRAVELRIRGVDSVKCALEFLTAAQSYVPLSCKATTSPPRPYSLKFCIQNNTWMVT